MAENQAAPLSRVLRLAMVYFTPTALMLALFLTYAYRSEREAVFREFQGDQRADVQLQEARYRSYLEDAAMDLLYLTRQQEAYAALALGDEDARASLVHEVGAFAQARGLYAGVLWLDTQGRERIRVGRDAPAASVAPAGAASQPYFTHVAGQPEGTVYVSPLAVAGDDTGGDGTVLRLAMPVYREGTWYGVLALVVDAGAVLEEIASAADATPDNELLLAEDGDWLLGGQGSGGDATENTGDTPPLSAGEPQLWELFTAGEAGQATYGGALYSFETFEPVAEVQRVLAAALGSTGQVKAVGDGDRFWKVVSHVEPTHLDALTRTTELVFLGMAALLLVVTAAASFAMARARAELEHSRGELRSAYDELHTVVGELEASVREKTSLHDMKDLLLVCESQRELFSVTSAYFGKLFPSGGWLYLRNGESGAFELVSHWGEVEAGADFPEGGACWALRRTKTHRVCYDNRELQCDHIPPGFRDGYVCVPVSAHGSVLGLLTVACSRCDQQTGCGGRNAPDDATVESVAGTLGLIVASLRLQESLRDQSIRDGLTGLFNRRYLEETLERELRRADRESLPLSVLVFDVDHFKSVNDTYGHEAGDEVLRTLAGLLQRNIRGGDVPCRFGGEEFVVILPGANLDVGHERAEHLRGTIAALRIATRAARLQVTVSVGVAMYSGDQAETGEDLLQAADRALYRAKQGGRNRVELAAPDSAGMPLLEAPAQSSSTTSP